MQEVFFQRKNYIRNPKIPYIILTTPSIAGVTAANETGDRTRPYKLYQEIEYFRFLAKKTDTDNKVPAIQEWKIRS